MDEVEHGYKRVKIRGNYLRVLHMLGIRVNWTWRWWR